MENKINYFVLGSLFIIMILIFIGSTAENLKETGRYQAGEYQNGAGVYILDTKTGNVKVFDRELEKIYRYNYNEENINDIKIQITRNK